MRRDEERVAVHGFGGFGEQESFWRANAKGWSFGKNEGKTVLKARQELDGAARACCRCHIGGMIVSRCFTHSQMPQITLACPSSVIFGRLVRPKITWKKTNRQSIKRNNDGNGWHQLPLVVSRCS